MACSKYSNCEFCGNDNNCQYDHYGDGNAYCGKFVCTQENCKRSECISYEEQLD